MLSKTVEMLKESGISVGGMMSREVRDRRVRVGFEIEDLTSGRHGWLAHVNQRGGPQVGKYQINLADLDSVGAKAITQATKDCAVVAIDEIGPMELFSIKFKQAVQQAIEGDKVLLVVIHAKTQDPLISQIRRRSDAETFTLSLANRDFLSREIAEKILNLTRGK